MNLRLNVNIILSSNPDLCSENCQHSRALTVGTRVRFGRQSKAAHGFLLVLVCFGSSFLNAQQQSGPPQSERRVGVEELARTANATRVERAPKLDGTLNDPSWQMASPVANFLQREPFEGQPPTEKTEVRILYDKHSVYFGVLCFDSEPSKIVASELRRDVSQELDDYFEIIIDSAHDLRNAYVFQTNPLGTQRDALITEEQHTDSGTSDGDPGWDGVWTSEARTSKEGWIATLVTPFSTLNFMQSSDVIWGNRLKPFIGRKNERGPLVRLASATVPMTVAADRSQMVSCQGSMGRGAVGQRLE